MPLLQLYKNLVSAYYSINLFAVKSFKVPILLTLTAALSCGANSSPVTNATADGLFKRDVKQDLTAVMKSLPNLATNVYDATKGKDELFTKRLIDELWANRNYPGRFNYVICHVDHDYNFDGTEGTDWAHAYVENGYFDVVVGGKGTFTRHTKNHGYKNWAWHGVVVITQDVNSNVVKFLDPATGLTPAGGGGKVVSGGG